MEVEDGIGEESELERSHKQEGDPCRQERERRPAHPARFVSCEKSVRGLVAGRVVGAEQHRHDQADANAECERQQEARRGEVGTEHAARIDERQDVGCGCEE